MMESVVLLQNTSELSVHVHRSIFSRLIKAAASPSRLALRATAPLMLVCSLWPAPGSAQPSLSEEERQERFAEYATDARARYDEGDYPAAIELLQRANMLILDDRIMYNIGTSYEKMEDCVRAMAYYDAALRVENTSEEWRKKIASKRKALSKGCPDYDASEATGRISITSSPEGAAVTIDGDEVGQTPLEVIMLPAGRHTFKVSREGREPITETVALSAQADLALDYQLAAVEQAAGADLSEKLSGGSDSITPPQNPEPESAGPHLPSIALAGVGALGLGAGAYLNWVQLCPDPDCKYERERDEAAAAGDFAQVQALSEERQRRARLMFATTTAGALMVLGGVTWFVLQRREERGEQERALLLSPLLTPQGAGAELRWRF